MKESARMSVINSIDDEHLDATFSALANATRRAILTRLAEGDATVNELADPFDLTLPAISKHIKVLEQAGLVVRGHRAQYRPCALNAEALVEVSSWAERHRRIWEERFDRMEDRIKERAKRGKDRTR
jgi:DNA-binding transcriptional ArsR family regulator